MHKYYKKLTNRYKRLKDLSMNKPKETSKGSFKDNFLPYIKNEKTKIKVSKNYRPKHHDSKHRNSKERIDDRLVSNEQYLSINLNRNKKHIIKEVKSLKFSNMGTVTEASTKSTAAFNQNKKKKHKKKKDKERSVNSQMI